MFSFINHLRILQKVTRRKAHRCLLLISYRASVHLRKSLKVPVPDMRYYTLKLFKSQVPFCGRKWRQSNMKIITAVWLSVPVELRDDWLVGGGGGGMGGSGLGDTDGAVGEAVALEQSLRSLTFWWNCRVCPEEMGKKKKRAKKGQNGVTGGTEEGVDAEGGDTDDDAMSVGFFEREIGRMDGLLEGLQVGSDEGLEDWESALVQG